jgi:hypothetical protein
VVVVKNGTVKSTSNQGTRGTGWRKDGKQSRCKACMRAAQNERRRGKPAKPKPYMTFTCRGCGISYQKNGRAGSRRLCADCVPHSRVCGRCDTCKPLDQFSSRSRTCRRCLQAYNRERIYGFSPGTAEVILAEFGDSCAICGETAGGPRCPKQALHVDHCHGTGVVRGLLCSFCNSGIGYFGDDSKLLAAAIAYLERTRQLSFDEAS